LNDGVFPGIDGDLSCQSRGRGFGHRLNHDLSVRLDQPVVGVPFDIFEVEGLPAIRKCAARFFSRKETYFDHPWRFGQNRRMTGEQSDQHPHEDGFPAAQPIE